MEVKWIRYNESTHKIPALFGNKPLPGWIHMLCRWKKKKKENRKYLSATLFLIDFN